MRVKVGLQEPDKRKPLELANVGVESVAAIVSKDVAALINAYMNMHPDWEIENVSVVFVLKNKV